MYERGAGSMLRLILGRAGSGKTEYVRDMLAKRLEAGDSGLLLIVPEQFSFETERDMLRRVGPQKMLNLEIVSFSRLAELLLERTGCIQGEKITDGMRAVFMRIALESLADKTEIYTKYKASAPLLQSLVTFSTELTQCAVSAAALETASCALPEGTLRRKLNELSQITALYKALVHNRFQDDTELLTDLEVLLSEQSLLRGKTVVFDAFAGFTRQERGVLSAMLCQCADVYVTLCTDPCLPSRNACVFDNVQDEMEKLKRAAAKCGAAVAKPVVLTAAGGEPALAFLEKNLYAFQKPQFAEQTDAVSVYAAANRSEEADFVARTIRKHLQNGMRAQDILVLERRKDTYDTELAFAFQKYDIPFFADKRQPIAAQPLVLYVSAVLEIAAKGLTTETLLRALKTGLFPLSDEEIAALETYATVWGIDRGAWKIPFTENPSGFGREMQEQDAVRLARLNMLREQAVTPILHLREAFLPADGTEKCRLLYRHLREIGADTALRDLAISLSADGRPEAAQQQDTIWTLLTQLLEDLHLAVGDSEISAAQFSELFSILVESADLGQLPQGLDAVQIAAADRVRRQRPKIVFAVGMNDGVFPENPPTDGVLNDRERKTLSELGVVLTETAEVKAVDERFFVYTAFSLPTQRLYASYACASYTGAQETPSGAVEELRALFLQLRETDSTQVNPLERAQSYASAFSVCADLYRENSTQAATLRALFADMPTYGSRLAALQKAVERRDFSITSKETATALFHKDMLLSASKAEVYYKCPFSYFCKFGLRLQPMKKAELDFAQSGTVIHSCLEKLLFAYDKDTLLSWSDAQLRAQIASLIAAFAADHFGAAAQESRFARLLSNLETAVFDVVKRLLSEFAVSAFIPTAFELSIAPDGEIPPYRLPLEDGGSIRIIGSVDRVDTMQKNGKTYLRVIDYKSGGKKFNLNEVFDGLNMQMLIYLFAVCENGTEKFPSAVPAGVLYLPAKSFEDGLPRGASAEEIQKKRLQNARMQGVVLNETDAVLGMDNTVSDTYIHAAYDKSGSGFRGDLLTAAEFAAVRKTVRSNLQAIGMALHNGEIPARPAATKNDTMGCAYCDYQSLCGFEAGDAVRRITDSSSFAEAKKRLQQIEKEETECLQEAGQPNSSKP